MPPTPEIYTDCHTPSRNDALPIGRLFGGLRQALADLLQMPTDVDPAEAVGAVELVRDSGEHADALADHFHPLARIGDILDALHLQVEQIGRAQRLNSSH